MGSLDNINELIENIQKDNFDYVIGIIKPHLKDKERQSIEIFTNLNEEPLDRLLRVLKEHKKSLQNKLKNGSFIEMKDKNDKTNLS